VWRGGSGVRAVQEAGFEHLWDHVCQVDAGTAPIRTWQSVALHLFGSGLWLLCGAMRRHHENAWALRNSERGKGVRNARGCGQGTSMSCLHVTRTRGCPQ